MKKTFLYPIKVSHEHIDSLNHVNNEIYIKWLMEAAMAHSAVLGYPMEKYLADQACFVVRRHEVDYLAPAYLNEDLVLETWIQDMQTTKTHRVYHIKRISDNKVLINAKTLWVYISLQTGKATEIPSELKFAFSEFIHS